MRYLAAVLDPSSTGRAAVLLLLVTCAWSSGGSPQAGPPDRSTEPDHLTAASIMRELTRAVEDDFEHVRRTVDEPYALAEDGPVPRRVRARSFAARTPVAGGAPGVRLRFVLRIYEYRDPEAASESLGHLRAEVAESMLHKSPMLVMRHGPLVVRLDGECTFSDQRWAEVEAALCDVLSMRQGRPHDQLAVRCGGQVVPTSPPDGATYTFPHLRAGD